MVEKLSVGLWGCGNMGRSQAMALLATGEADLPVVYDILPAAAESLAQDTGASAVTDQDAFLGWPGLDGVIIAIPGYVHAGAAVAAAEAGLHVFVEKPMALNTADCRRMIDVAAKQDVKLMVGQVLRYYEPYRSILEWSRSGRFGRVFAASIWRLSNGSRWDVPGYWRAERAKSGGYLMEVGAHELDMLRCLFGKPDRVSALSRKVIPWGHDMLDYIGAHVHFSDGSAAHYEGGGGVGSSAYGFRFFFERATMVSDKAFDRNALRIVDIDGQPVDLSSHAFSQERPVECELRDWMAAIREGCAIAIPGEEGMATVALAQAIYRAAESGRIESVG